MSTCDDRKPFMMFLIQSPFYSETEPEFT